MGFSTFTAASYAGVALTFTDSCTFNLATDVSLIITLYTPKTTRNKNGDEMTSCRRLLAGGSGEPLLLASLPPAAGVEEVVPAGANAGVCIVNCSRKRCLLFGAIFTRFFSTRPN